MANKPDYSEIQTEAARRILIEVMNIDVADFLDEKDDEIYAINCQDAFQVVQAFLQPILLYR
jgi:hypothetical protein